MGYREINTEFQINNFKKHIDKIYAVGFNVQKIKRELSMFRRTTSNDAELFEEAKQYLIEKDTEMCGSSNVNFHEVFE